MGRPCPFWCHLRLLTWRLFLVPVAIFWRVSWLPDLSLCISFSSPNIFCYRLRTGSAYSFYNWKEIRRGSYCSRSPEAVGRQTQIPWEPTGWEQTQHTSQPFQHPNCAMFCDRGTKCYAMDEGYRVSWRESLLEEEVSQLDWKKMEECQPEVGRTFQVGPEVLSYGLPVHCRMLCPP